MVYMIIEVIYILKYCPKSCLFLSVDDQRLVKEKYSVGFNSAIADRKPQNRKNKNPCRNYPLYGMKGISFEEKFYLP